MNVDTKPDIMVDSKKGILIVKRGTVVVKNIKFDGDVIAGAGSSFLGNIYAKEVYLSKGCIVNGKIKCCKAIIGAKSKFKSIECDGDVLILDKCVGGSIKSLGNVRIGNSIVTSVEAKGIVVVDGSAKLEKLIASKVIASNSAKSAGFENIIEINENKETEKVENVEIDNKAEKK